MEEDRICGANAVAALFARRPEAAKRLFYTKDMKERAGPLCAAMAKLRRPYRLLDEAEMERAAGSIHHGGIAGGGAAAGDRDHRLRAAAEDGAIRGAGPGQQPA